FTTDAAEAVKHGQYQFIAVGTPPGEDGSADLKYVLQVAHTIGEHMTDHRVIITKSTVPVGTCDKVRAEVKKALAACAKEVEFDVVSNPEFLKEGAAIADFTRPDRIVIGTDSVKAEKLMRDLYEPFNHNHDRLIAMDIRSSELTKYAANALLATKISFMNELANVAEQVGADIEHVRVGIGSDPRIGYHFIYPGCGYGGSCFPKDVKALVHTASAAGVKPSILMAVEEVNERQKTVLFARISSHFGGSLGGKTLAVWGLSFKPKTDDIREATSRVLMEALWAAGARVKAYDPVAMHETQKAYGSRGDLKLCETAEQAVDGADALVIVTEWKQFRSPNFARVAKLLKQPVIFDGRNLYDPEFMKRIGFTYFSIGRQMVSAETAEAA
ncbi:MAG: UDP-glucose dehydrogenase family protein, partial [Stenotrophobium sp.]